MSNELHQFMLIVAHKTLKKPKAKFCKQSHQVQFQGILTLPDLTSPHDIVETVSIVKPSYMLHLNSEAFFFQTSRSSETDYNLKLDQGDYIKTCDDKKDYHIQSLTSSIHLLDKTHIH